VTEQRYFVARRPDNGRWAVWELRPDGTRAWIDEGWRDSADAEIQRLQLEQLAENRSRAHG